MLQTFSQVGRTSSVMAHRISVQERAQVAAHYEVWHSVVQVQRWWRTVHGPRATLDPKTIKKCHDKLMNTGSVLDIRRSGRPSTSRSEENVRMVQDMFTRSPQKSTRQAARESGLSRHTIRNVLKKELNSRPWKPHYCQQLSPEDCDHRMEYVSGNAKMTGRGKSERNAVKRSSENETSDKKQKKTKKKQVPKRLKPNDLNPDDILQSSYNGIRTPVCGLNRLKDSFYDVPCEDLAKGLLGKVLVRRINDGTLIKGRIVETECYPGGEDKASCSHNGRITETIKAVYMKPGTAFVYSTYGMYHCINISSQGAGAAVLLRALEPLEGLEYMQLQRQKGRKAPSSQKELKAQDLCNGPVKLCTSFSITKSSCNEQDLTTWDGMWIQEDESIVPRDIVTSHRIGIDSVGTKWASEPFRFYLLGNASVSRRDKVREETFKQ